MGEGERLHASRRKHFWTIIGGLMLLGLVTGLVAGALLAVGAEREAPLSPMMAGIATAVIALALAAIVYGSWRFFVSVDEVEVQDNLWACLIGFYAYAILFPAWWLMARIGLLPFPDQWVMYAVIMVSGTAAYAYRKWQSR